MGWLVVLYLINTALMVFIAIREVRRPAAALNWITIGLILPVIGFILYLLTSNPVRIRRERLTSTNNPSETLPDSFSRAALVIAHALRHLTVHGVRAGEVQMLTNGLPTFDKLITSIRNAQRTIDMEYYIYRDDHIGRRITDVLIERAASGVRIRFLRDGFGSRKFARSQIMRMIDAGIECRTFFPLRFPWLISALNYRDHCKILVIDGKEAFTGGINVGDEYTGLKPNIGFWRDTHVRVVGEPVVDLHNVFRKHWNIASPERTRSHIITQGRPGFSGSLVECGAELGIRDGTADDTCPVTAELKKSYVQTFEGNPTISTQVIREVYFVCLTQASHTIDITTPYFVPDADIIMALKTAVARGVRVRLLVPHHVSPQIVIAASRTYYGELLEAGVQIYQYKKGVLHAKVMVIDGEVAVVGSANYDIRSFRLDFEVCQVVYSVDVARELEQQFECDLADSVPVRMEELKQRSRSQRILDQGARLLSPLL